MRLREFKPSVTIFFWKLYSADVLRKYDLKFNGRAKMKHRKFGIFIEKDHQATYPFNGCLYCQFLAY